MSAIDDLPCGLPCEFCGAFDFDCTCSDSCIHTDGGLCDRCAAESSRDPDSWREFGRHKAGEERWRKLQAEIEADRDRAAPGFTDVPY